ncbi:MAG TPA: glycosyltransferase, partial [Solirubrobacteraceae bacterium]
MRVSVVINTYNRARSLRATLDALRRQTFRDFEVVVVNGPSTDGTAELLAGLEGQVRTVDCPERHLAKSRNLGIDAAAGDVVAFIDDDAIPEARWLADLVAAYDDERVGGAGGIVLDHTGTHPQYRYSVCDRIGITDFEVEPPFDAYNVPGADPYVYLQGTNASFRRSVLAEIGGFDEEIEYNYDESEACLQVVDAGHELRPLTGAVVHHKFLPSHMRREAGFFTDPYFPVKNRAYFALRNGRSHRSLEEIFESLTDYMRVLLAWADDCEEHGRFTTLERDHFVARLQAGFELGVERGLAGVRRSRPIAPQDPDAFLAFPTLVPEGRRLGVCFVSLDYPPGPIGGIARFTNDLARGFAARGHEVHVVTKAEGRYRTDFEDGVWVHRYPHSERWVDGVREHPLAGNLEHLAAVWNAVNRVLERAPIDVVSGPLWVAEPLFCGFDPRVTTAMTCMTPMRVIAETQPALAGLPHTRFQIELEDAALSRVQLLQPVSHANLETLRRLVPAARDVPAEVVWHGVDDRRAEFPRTRPEDPDDTEILFVGRLEPRKGVDTLLEAAIDLVRERPGLRVRLAGADTGHSTEGNQTYAAWLGERLAGEPALLARFVFEGEVSDETLYRLYADCDVFCAPSRYESFGLVLAEAQMMGRPVVACRAGGMPEVVADGETGLLVEPGDVDGLRAALARLVDDRELRARMGAAARGRFEQEFHNDVAVARTLALYERLAAARDGAPRASAAAALEAVQRGVAALLSDLVGLPPGPAEQSAARLLDPVAFPVDYEAGVRRLLPLGDEAFVVGLYALLLGREPEPEGLRNYVASLGGGLRRVDLIRTVASSDEARLRGVGSAFLERLELLDRAEAERRVRAVWTLDDDAFVTGLHAALLGGEATPDVDAEARARLAAGASRRSLLEALVADGRAGRRVAEAGALLETEYLDRGEILAGLGRIAGLAPRDFVDGLYRLLLGRPADPDGLAGAVRGLGAGTPREQLVRAIAESPEAQTRGLERG